MKNIKNFPCNTAINERPLTLGKSLLQGTFYFMKPHENLSPEDMDGEIWKIIPELPLYEASSYGRIRFYPNERIRKQQKRRNYLALTIEQGEINNSFWVHRMVAQAFIENPNSYPMINHLDGDKYNNRPENLQWCNAKMNVNHAIETGLSVKEKGEFIVQMDMKGNTIKIWEGINNAERTLGITSIDAALQGRQSQAGGFTWKYLDEYKNTKKFVFAMKMESRQPVIQLTKDGEFVNSWKTMVEAERKLDMWSGTILKCIKNQRKTAGGFKWQLHSEWIKTITYEDIKKVVDKVISENPIENDFFFYVSEETLERAKQETWFKDLLKPK